MYHVIILGLDRRHHDPLLVVVLVVLPTPAKRLRHRQFDAVELRVRAEIVLIFNNWKLFFTATEPFKIYFGNERTTATTAGRPRPSRWGRSPSRNLYR